VICHPQTEGVERVIRAKCAEQNAAVLFVKTGGVLPVVRSLDGLRFDYGGMKGIEIPLIGSEQCMNAAVAVETVNALRQKGWHITESALRRGLGKVRWPGRFEVLHRGSGPVFIVDGSHNPQGVQTAADNLRALFPDRKAVFVFGVLSDKDYTGMLEILVPLASRFVCITPEGHRGLDAGVLTELIKGYGVEAVIFDDIERGVRHAVESTPPDGLICAIGSLSTVDRIRRCVKGGEWGG
jgi:dihydrofolate synthase/folylpolyglutamate synthase